MIGYTKNGTPLNYRAPVVEHDANGAPSDLPSLVGNEDLAKMNTLYDCRSGYLHLLPQTASWQDIAWPAGTKHLEMDRAPSGHWVLTVSHFELAKPSASASRAS